MQSSPVTPGGLVSLCPEDSPFDEQPASYWQRKRLSRFGVDHINSDESQKGGRETQSQLEVDQLLIDGGRKRVRIVRHMPLDKKNENALGSRPATTGKSRFSGEGVPWSTAPSDSGVRGLSPGTMRESAHSSGPATLGTLSGGTTLVGGRIKRRARTASNPDGPMALATEFARQAQELGEPFSSTSRGALAKYFSGWLKDGVPVEVIRLTFRYYFHHAHAPHKPGQPRWRAYIAARDKYLHQAQRRHSELEQERNRFTKGERWKSRPSDLMVQQAERAAAAESAEREKAARADRAAKQAVAQKLQAGTEERIRRHAEERAAREARLAAAEERRRSRMGMTEDEKIAEIGDILAGIEVRSARH